MDLKVDRNDSSISQGSSLNGNLDVVRDRVKNLLTKQESSNPRGRILIALAGVPGSGKSTVSDAMLRALPEHGIEDIAVLPMDGYHYSKATLATFNDPERAFKRRGAPFTFDSEALLSKLSLLKEMPVSQKHEPETLILSPGFDHTVGDPVPDAICISSRCRIVIVEGNYTLLDEDVWRDIAALVDERWFVDIPAEIARERIALRHLRAGIEASMEAAVARADENDLPNGDLVRSKLIQPDIRIVN